MKILCFLIIIVSALATDRRLNTASGQFADIAGGYGNVASGDYSSVLGGRNNNAFGYGSAVLGGFENTVTGDYSAVSGYAGNSRHNNSLVLAFNGINQCNSYSEKSISVCSPNGFYINDLEIYSEFKKINTTTYDLKNQQTTNTANIQTNTNNIGTNTQDITANTANIQTNMEGIQTNMEGIQTNMESIQTNVDNITFITANTETNANNITKNLAKIKKNTININILNTTVMQIYNLLYQVNKTTYNNSLYTVNITNNLIELYNHSNNTEEQSEVENENENEVENINEENSEIQIIKTINNSENNWLTTLTIWLSILSCIQVFLVIYSIRQKNKIYTQAPKSIQSCVSM